MTPTATPPAGTVAPTIASDLADYAPGGTVTLTGLGWQPGEDVTIVVNDTGGLSWSLTQKVVADAEGRITLAFNLPNYYVPDYDVTATGALSGVATSTFTDAATDSWRYWMTSPVPATGANILAGSAVVYNLCADTLGGTLTGDTCSGTGAGTPSVNDAVATLTLSDNVSGALVSKVTLSGTTAFGKVTAIGGTATWTLSTAPANGLTNTDRSAVVTAQIAASAPAGTLTATISAVSPGTPRTGTGFTSVSHSIPKVGACSLATPGSGTFSRSICWFDLAGYNAAAAAIGDGQRMQQTLPNGYVLSYTIKAGTPTNPNTNVIAHKLPTYTAAFLGNTGTSYANNYLGIAGMPALLQQTNGATNVLTLTGITLKDNGTPVTGFALVGADAESTDSGESITWHSDKVLTSIGGDLGNACGGPLVFSSDNRSATCNAGPAPNKSGAAILYTQDPTEFSQTMKGSGLQAVAFGVIVSGLQLNKKIVNQLPNDQFRISVKRLDKTELGFATNAPDKSTASTEQVNTIGADTKQKLYMSETAVGTTNLANYKATWECTINDGPLTPDVVDENTRSADVGLKDLVACTITNTGSSLTLKKVVDNTGGGTLKPEDWILTAKSASATVIAAAPSAATGSTATVPVPVGSYTLAESSSAAGAGRYFGGDWSCTNGVVVTQNVISMAAGNNVTCTIINTFVPRVTMRNTWVNGVSGDKAELVISKGLITLGQAISTSNGNAGPFLDTLNVVSATPTVGDLITVAESMKGTNAGTYTTTLVGCVKGLNVPVGVSGGGQFTMPNSDVTCDFSNRPTAGTVTWSKVDAGSTSTLLTGSEWTLLGPSNPAPGITVTDCTVAPCAGPDTDPAAGQFKVAVLCGTCSLVEKTAPIGFRVDGKSHTFTIADGQVFAFGAIANERSAVPALPLTGGASTDSFLLAGYALIAAAGFTARRHRRRLLRL